VEDHSSPSSPAIPPLRTIKLDCSVGRPVSEREREKAAESESELAKPYSP